MRPLLLAALLLLLAGCGGGDRLGGAAVTTAAGKDVLTGYLRFAGGPSASSRVKVSVFRNGHRVAVQTASDSGRFRFRLTRGTYDLRAKAGEEKCRLHVAVHAPLVRANLPCLGGLKE